MVLFSNSVCATNETVAWGSWQNLAARGEGVIAKISHVCVVKTRPGNTTKTEKTGWITYEHAWEWIVHEGWIDGREKNRTRRTTMGTATHLPLGGRPRPLALPLALKLAPLLAPLLALGGAGLLVPLWSPPPVGTVYFRMLSLSLFPWLLLFF